MLRRWTSSLCETNTYFRWTSETERKSVLKSMGKIPPSISQLVDFMNQSTKVCFGKNGSGGKQDALKLIQRHLPSSFTEQTSIEFCTALANMISTMPQLERCKGLPVNSIKIYDWAKSGLHLNLKSSSNELRKSLETIACYTASTENDLYEMEQYFIHLKKDINDEIDYFPLFVTSCFKQNHTIARNAFDQMKKNNHDRILSIEKDKEVIGNEMNIENEMNMDNEMMDNNDDCLSKNKNDLIHWEMMMKCTAYANPIHSRSLKNDKTTTLSSIEQYERKMMLKTIRKCPLITESHKGKKTSSEFVILHQAHLLYDLLLDAPSPTTTTFVIAMDTLMKGGNVDGQPHLRPIVLRAIFPLLRLMNDGETTPSQWEEAIYAKLLACTLGDSVSAMVRGILDNNTGISPRLQRAAYTSLAVSGVCLFSGEVLTNALITYDGLKQATELETLEEERYDIALRLAQVEAAATLGLSSEVVRLLEAMRKSGLSKRISSSKVRDMFKMSFKSLSHPISECIMKYEYSLLSENEEKIQNLFSGFLQELYAWEFIVDQELLYRAITVWTNVAELCASRCQEEGILYENVHERIMSFALSTACWGNPRDFILFLKKEEKNSFIEEPLSADDANVGTSEINTVTTTSNSEPVYGLPKVNESFLAFLNDLPIRAVKKKELQIRQLNELVKLSCTLRSSTYLSDLMDFKTTCTGYKITPLDVQDILKVSGNKCENAPHVLQDFHNQGIPPTGNSLHLVVFGMLLRERIHASQLVEEEHLVVQPTIRNHQDNNPIMSISDIISYVESWLLMYEQVYVQERTWLRLLDRVQKKGDVHELRRLLYIIQHARIKPSPVFQIYLNSLPK